MGPLAFARVGTRIVLSLPKSMNKKRGKTPAGKMAKLAAKAAMVAVKAVAPRPVVKGIKAVSKGVGKLVANPALRSFAAAVHDPFSEAAAGARVLDLYSLPTETRKIQTTFVLDTDATGSGGVILFGNPYITVCDLGLIGSTGTSISSLGGLRRFPANPQFLGITTPYLCIPEFEGFRVVGVGYRVSNPQIESTAKGRIYVAHVPLATRGMPGLNELENVSAGITATGNAGIFSRAGLPDPAICDSAAIQALPGAQFHTVGELIEGNESIELRIGVNHPDFYQFRSSSTTNAWDSAGLYRAGDEGLTVTATGLTSLNSIGDKAPTQCDGSNAIILYYEGFPASLAEALIVEVIFHLEVTPVLRPNLTSGTGGILPLPDSTAEVEIGSSMAVEALLAAEHRYPKTRMVKGHGSTGPQFLNRKNGNSSVSPNSSGVSALAAAASRFL